MRWTVAMALVGGCTPWLDLPEDQVPVALSGVEAGRYDGVAILEVRAYFGPVRVGRDTCEIPVSLEVDPGAEWLVDGPAGCDLDGIGRFDARITGDSVGMPYLEGTLSSSDVQAPWDGWFTATDALYGEIDGESYVGSLRLEHVGYMEVAWADTLGPAAN